MTPKERLYMESPSLTYRIQKAQYYGREFDVLDAHGRLCYYIKQMHFATSRTLIVEDPKGNPIAKIKQSFPFLAPKYRISFSAENRKAFTLKRKISLRPVYQISGIPWDIYTVNHGRGYHIYNATHTKIFDVERVTRSRPDKYLVTTQDPQLLLHGICLAMAIDCAIEDLRVS